MRIYVQGYGGVSAAGSSAAERECTLAGGVARWTRDEQTGLPVYRVEELPRNPRIVGYTRDGRTDRTALLALYAADSAVTMADWAGREFSVLAGSSRGPTGNWESAHDIFQRSDAVPPRTSPTTTLGHPAFVLADHFGVSRFATGLSVTCSSGFHALLQGVALLRAGMAERVLVGGAEAPLTAFTLRQMAALRIVAAVPTDDLPPCRPLYSPATGMALGEGAGFLALSTEPGPFELTGLGFAREATPSATGITAAGEALLAAMRMATAAAGLPDFTVAHAPGTRAGDAAELAAVKELYRGVGEDPVLTSYKWSTGHTLGASGPLGLVMALETLAQGKWYGLPYAPLRETPRALGSALINATGFGGNAVSVAVRRVLG